MLAPNTILQNRYRVIRQLGQGGMGAVYEALDQRVSSVVALKETLVGADPEAHRAFEREAALLANSRHAALPKVMDYFSENENEFLVMEYIAGADLAALLSARDTPFPELQVLRWADAILALLEYLHAREPPILHRDIKPSNLKVNPEGEIFLLDFGLAKGAAGQMPTLGMSLSVRGFTPAYAPIEQITGHGTEVRSDLYALGATLYHLLTARPPLDSPTRFEAIDDGRSDPQPSVDQLNPRVSPTTAEIVARAMAVSRRNRPSSATEMRRALADVGSQLQASSEAQTLTPNFGDPIAGSTLPQSQSADRLRISGPKEASSPTIPSPPFSPKSPSAAATLPVNPALVHDNLPKRITTQPASVTTAQASSRAGIIAIGGVVSLMLVVAVGLIVWLALRSNATRSQIPSDAQSNAPANGENTNSLASQPTSTVQQNQNQASSISKPTPPPTPASGAITGSVSDANRAAIPGTSVTATRVADGRSFSKVTNDSGRFSLVDLPAGVYSVRFQAPGFSVSVYTGIKVGGPPARVNATLEVGSGAMTVTHRGK